MVSNVLRGRFLAQGFVRQLSARHLFWCRHDWDARAL